jgi:hypothetical protein
MPNDPLEGEIEPKATAGTGSAAGLILQISRGRR